MPTNPLFSTYRGGENRVTSSTMAVFERIDLALVRDILAAATGSGEELRAVTFENQVVLGGQAVPDARISGRFTWWFETKTARNAYNSPGHDREQLLHHAKLLEEDTDAILFVLTPDAVRPAWFVEGYGGGQVESVTQRIVWLPFKDLADAIERISTDPTRLLGEQTRYLLTELVALYETDDLLTNDDTVIVAARRAWPEYLAVSAYICQPDRPFREGPTHLGFYTEGAVQPLVPRIRAKHPNVPFTREEAERQRAVGDAEVATLIETALSAGQRADGESYGIILLTGPDDEGTVRLARPVENDAKSAAGKPWAWTLSQRYTSLDRLQNASLTSQL